MEMFRSRLRKNKKRKNNGKKSAPKTRVLSQEVYGLYFFFSLRRIIAYERCNVENLKAEAVYYLQYFVSRTCQLKDCELVERLECVVWCSVMLLLIVTL